MIVALETQHRLYIKSLIERYVLRLIKTIYSMSWGWKLEYLPLQIFLIFIYQYEAHHALHKYGVNYVSYILKRLHITPILFRFFLQER